MDMDDLKLATFAALVLAATGCVVYYDPPPRRVYVSEGPRPYSDVVVTDDDEVHYVVYREYFGWSDDVIAVFPYYRRYYGLTYDDLYFISYVGCYRGIAFDACFRSYYYGCGRNYDQLVVAYDVPRSAFFCSVNVGVGAYPAVYQRTYVAYHENNLANISIQNHEYAALVQMRVGVDYQGHEPGAFFAQVNAHGGNPGRVIVANREMCGKGGVSATGARVSVAAPRPWTMPPGQKQAWHQQQVASATRHSESFKMAHHDQVQKVQSQDRGHHPDDHQHPVHQVQEHPPGKPPPPKGEHEEKK
jgi:hypothetical protein